MTDPPFKTGDKVRLKTGKSPIQVVEVGYYDEGQKLPHYAKHKWGSPGRKHSPKAGWYISFRYLSSLNCDEARKWREADDFVFFDPQPEKEPEMASFQEKQKLYQTGEDPVRYGTFLTVNSMGQFVLEMKGEGGKCEPFDEKDIEIVTPHTIELTKLKLVDGEKAHAIHVVARKGQAEKDDVLLELNSGLLWRVTDLNSKCLSPRDNKSKWMKIPAELMTFGEQ